MAGNTPQYAEALVVRDGRIAFVGGDADALERAGADAATVDLRGRTLLPGFIDAHGHIPDYVTTWGLPNLSPPPVGEVRTIADLQRKLREGLPALKPGEAVIGSGYDDSLLAERRHITRAELDEVATDRPVIARHASGHLLVANSAAIAKAGLSKDTPNPEGGVMRRAPDGELTGIMEEQALLPFMAMLQAPDDAEWTRRMVEVQRMYAGYGITTAADHLSDPRTIANLRRSDAEGKLILDVVSYPMYLLFDQVIDGQKRIDGVSYFPPGSTVSNMGHLEPLERLPAAASLKDPSTGKVVVGAYVGHHKIQGIKISIDGSPQGKTAYLRQPYKVPPPGTPADYRAYPTMSQERLNAWLDAAYRSRVQVIVHCNGDAASAMMIEAVRQAQAKYGRPDIRPVMIHAQTATHEQIDMMKELGIIPSFFTAHTFYWGDWHRDETLGSERAARISSLNYAARQGMRYTNHTDSPVVPPNMMHLLWSAVNRITRSGQVLGPDERATPYAALKAITDHAAYQTFEDRAKGTLEPGKLADLVILDRNPLKVEPTEIRMIKVTEAIKDGETVFEARE
jgi:predicted amidohydrolase YtcJ